MSELSDYFKASKYSQDLGMQITADNVDCIMKGELEHWILAYSRLDPITTKNLSTEEPEFDIHKASHEIVYLTDEEIDYLMECCKRVLVKKLHGMNIGFSNILKRIPFKPVHNYHEVSERQETFYECLEPLHEMEHQGNMFVE